MNPLRRARFTRLVTFGFTFVVSAGAGLAQLECFFTLSKSKRKELPSISNMMNTPVEMLDGFFH
jgi:hypothetical protein